MKKFILYLILVLGIAQLNYSCVPESEIPFLANMRIVADSLLDAPFPDSLNFENRGIELSKEQYYALTSDSIEGKRIVAIKKYNDNFLVFFLYDKMWINTILFNKEGKVLDRCEFWGVIPPSCRLADNGRRMFIINFDTLNLNKSIWNARYLDGNKIELVGAFPKNDTIKAIYSISDKITMINKTTSKEVGAYSLNIKLLAVSQVDRACELANDYKHICTSYYGCECFRWAFYATFELYPFVRYNPRGVLQWIYKHPDKEKVPETLFRYYDRLLSPRREEYSNFLRENVLKLKDKKAQEYLLNMKVFKENSESQEK